MKTVKFYTMLYVDTENQSLSINGISGTFDQQMKTFIKCCEVLGKSLIYFTNFELIVLTNNKTYIENATTYLQCLEIECNFELPKDIKFRGAHHKIDAFKYFAQQNDLDYSFLIDSDVVCINKMPLNLINCIKNNIPVYYDITEQMYPAFGRESLIKKKEVLISNNLSTGIWAGGEFIGGDNKFFKLLYDEIGLIWGKYVDNYKQLDHQGEETLVSAVIEKILQKKHICNAGLFGGIGRYWSVQTLHIQNHWKSYTNDFLLHLPADKNFIVSINHIDEQFVKKYENYLKKKQIASIMFIKKIIRKILRK